MSTFFKIIIIFFVSSIIISFVVSELDTFLGGGSREYISQEEYIRGQEKEINIEKSTIKNNEIFEIKSINHSDFTQEILLIANKYREENKVSPLTINTSKITQKIADDFSKYSTDEIPYTLGVETIISWNTYFDESDTNICKIGLSVCTFDPMKDGYNFFYDFLHKKNDIPAYWYEDFNPRDLLIGNQISVGISVRDTYPIEANYIIQIHR